MASKKPSQKQVDALTLINKGMQPTEAMIKAGYSKFTARNPKKNLLTKSQVVPIVDMMKLRLENLGITGFYLAEKLAEYAQSNNPKTFFSAYDRIKDVVGINPNQRDMEGVTRHVEYTEWVQSLPNPKIEIKEVEQPQEDIQT